MSAIRFTGTRKSSASLFVLSLYGFMKSSLRISPGCTGFLFFFFFTRSVVEDLCSQYRTSCFRAILRLHVEVHKRLPSSLVDQFPITALIENSATFLRHIGFAGRAPGPISLIEARRPSRPPRPESLGGGRQGSERSQSPFGNGFLWGSKQVAFRSRSIPRRGEQSVAR